MCGYYFSYVLRRLTRQIFIAAASVFDISAPLSSFVVVIVGFSCESFIVHLLGGIMVKAS